MQTTTSQSPLDGLWVLLVSNEGELAAQDSAGRVPMMCRAGNDQTYLLVFKNVVKQTAEAHGLRATFMPKPYITEAGNGLHIHQSLLGDDGRNAFATVDDEPPLGSKLMRRYLSGLLAHQVERLHHARKNFRQAQQA